MQTGPDKFGRPDAIIEGPDGPIAMEFKSAARPSPARKGSHGDSSPPPGSSGLATLAQEPTQTENVAATDALDRTRLTHALVMLLNERKDRQPLSIALFGHWGSGKSSQIEFLKGALRRLPGATFRFADFNAWRNERVDNIGAALAQTIVEALVEDRGFMARLRLAARLSARRRSTLRASIHKDVSGLAGKASLLLAGYGPALVWPALAAVIVFLLASNLGGSLMAWVSSGVVAALGAVLSLRHLVSKDLLNWFKSLAAPVQSMLVLPDYTDRIGSFHEINRTLEHLCALTLDDAGQSYLLVVIDDLDRCTPATVKQVFDAVRLVASVSHVVVLVALDERIAYAAVQKHYTDYGVAGRDASQVARDYLAKVFHLSIALPAVHPDVAATYIRARLFEESGPSTAAAPDAPAVPRQGKVTPAEVNAFVDVANEFGTTNPRELWRMRQSWSVLKGVALFGDGVDAPALATWLRHLFLREKIFQASEQQRLGFEKAVAMLESATASVPQDVLFGDKLESMREGFGQRDHVVRTVLLPAG